MLNFIFPAEETEAGILCGRQLFSTDTRWTVEPVKRLLLFYCSTVFYSVSTLSILLGTEGSKSKTCNEMFLFFVFCFFLFFAFLLFRSGFCCDLLCSVQLYFKSVSQWEISFCSKHNLTLFSIKVQYIDTFFISILQQHLQIPNVPLMSLLMFWD